MTRHLTSSEVDEIVEGAELIYGDLADRTWTLATVAVNDINHNPINVGTPISPLTGNEPPVVLIPNPGGGVKPNAKWFAEDGRHRTVAAERFGTSTLEGFIPRKAS